MKLLALILTIICCIYVTVWFCFVGGIIQILQSVQAENNMGIALGLGRFILTGPAFWFSVIIVAFEGVIFFDWNYE